MNESYAFTEAKQGIVKAIQTLYCECEWDIVLLGVGSL